jgi:ribosomal protein S18 acetylase RimI-like enzyme
MVGFVVLHLREPGTRMFSDVSFPEKYADIQFLDVQPNARRSGIATLILTDAEAQARAAGARSIMSEIREKETGKAQFFERLKYVKAGYEVDAYGPSRDGLIRTKQL